MEHQKTNRITKVLFTVYLVILLWILLFKLGVRFSYMSARKTSLIPFSDAVDASQLILNVLVFIPLGIYTAILFGRWSFWKKVLFVFLTSLLIEALQFVLAIGALDSTDIITNTAGGIVGIAVCKAIEKAFGNGPRTQRFINMIALIGTAFLVLFLLLLKMNILPVKYQ